MRLLVIISLTATVQGLPVKHSHADVLGPDDAVAAARVASSKATGSYKKFGLALMGGGTRAFVGSAATLRAISSVKGSMTHVAANSGATWSTLGILFSDGQSASYSQNRQPVSSLLQQWADAYSRVVSTKWDGSKSLVHTSSYAPPPKGLNTSEDGSVAATGAISDYVMCNDIYKPILQSFLTLIRHGGKGVNVQDWRDVSDQLMEPFGSRKKDYFDPTSRSRAYGGAVLVTAQVLPPTAWLLPPTNAALATGDPANADFCVGVLKVPHARTRAPRPV